MTKGSSVRHDGWQNLLTGVGISGVDKRLGTQYVGTMQLDRGTLTSLYRSEGLAKRIVNLPANDMVREWFTIPSDTDGCVLNEFKRLNMKAQSCALLQWARLYGGAIMVLGIDDGGTFEDELDEETIKNIEFIRVYDRWEISRESSYQDPESEKYGDTEFFMVSPSGEGNPYIVHESRVIVMDGENVPNIARQMNDGWGDSVLQAAYTRLRGIADAYAGVETIIQEFVIGLLTIENLQDLIASGQEDLVKKRLNYIDLSKHILNTVLIDTNEKFERHSSSVAGLPDLLDRILQSLSAVTGVPVTLMFGESPAGLNATGASDVRFYYDNIAGQQESKLQPVLERVAELVMLQQEGPFKGKEIEEWATQFCPLWQPTDKEVAETRKIVSDMDTAYVDAGVLLPEEVALSRFGGDTYSSETVLTDERIQRMEDDIDEAATEEEPEPPAMLPGQVPGQVPPGGGQTPIPATKVPPVNPGIPPGVEE